MGFKSDIEIAQETPMLHIREIAKTAGVDEKYLEQYGNYKAKVDYNILKDMADKPNGKLVLVTAINPTPAGEGKTTTSVGLADAMNALGKKTMLCLREPSLGPVFGVKGVAVQADGTLTAYLWPIGVDGRDLAAACAVAGCAVTPGELRGGDADQELEKRMDLLKTLVTSACCTAPLMPEMHPKLQFLAGTALQFGPGRYFYKSAWRGLRNRTFGMDFLVSLSSTLIYLYSAYVTFTPRRSYKLYFASDGVLLSLILFGKYMEQVAAGEANLSLIHISEPTRRS